LARSRVALKLLTKIKLKIKNTATSRIMALPDTSNTCDRVKVQVLTSLAMAIVPKALNGSLV
jgi:hypothetical protein